MLLYSSSGLRETMKETGYQTFLLLKKLIEHFHFCDNVPQTQVM